MCLFYLKINRYFQKKHVSQWCKRGRPFTQCDSPIYRRLLSFVCDFSYLFLKEKAPLEVAAIQATLDATLFKERIAPILEIQQRYGEEPYSEVTAVYNQAMQQVFGQTITLTIVPRLASDGELISATKVRKAMAEGDKETLKKFYQQQVINTLVEHKKLMR